MSTVPRLFRDGDATSDIKVGGGARLKLMPSREDIIKKEWLSHYNHFRLRLKQRYGIKITLKEYMELCRMPVEYFKHKKNTQNKKTGFIQIKGEKIMVIKEVARKRRLITALPYYAPITKPIK